MSSGKRQRLQRLFLRFTLLLNLTKKGTFQSLNCTPLNIHCLQPTSGFRSKHDIYHYLKNTGKTQAATRSYCPTISTSNMMPKEIFHRIWLSDEFLSWEILHSLFSTTTTHKWGQGYVNGLKRSYQFSPRHQKKQRTSWMEKITWCITFSSDQQ